MREPTDEMLAGALREGLDRLPTPTVYPGFDDYVVDTVRRRRRWWALWPRRERQPDDRPPMDTLRPVYWSPWLHRAALLALVGLLAVPTTRWLVSAHVADVFGLPPIGYVAVTAGLKGRELDRCRSYAAARPSDLGLQMALALYDPRLAPEPRTWRAVPPARASDDTPTQTGGFAGVASNGDRLRPLIGRFGDDPALLATILRLDTNGAVQIHRTDGDEFAGKTITPAMRAAARGLEPVWFGAYDDVAARGERADPDNAFFPQMRAIGLFAVRRDGEALAALRRAAAKPRWDDYVAVEPAAKSRLVEGALGARSELVRRSIWASVLYPHYEGLRGVARIAARDAMDLETGGHAAEGIGIRLDVMRVGGLMRSRSTCLIGSLAGVATEDTAISRPAGAIVRPPRTGRQMTAEQALERRRDLFVTYLQRHGLGREAAWARAELANAYAAKAAVSPLPDAWYFDIVRLAMVWWLCLLALLNVVTTLAAGGVGLLAARVRVVRTEQPVPPVALLGGVVGMVAASAVLDQGALAVSRLAIAIAAVALSLVAAWMVRRRWSLARRGVRPSLAWAAGSFGACCLLVCMAVLLAGSFAARVDAANGLLRAVTVDDTAGGQTVNTSLALYGAAVPLTVALLAALAAPIRRRPMLSSVVRGLRATGVPLACLLLLGYAGLVVATARMEAAATASGAAMRAGEPQRAAAANHRPWPGVAPLPK